MLCTVDTTTYVGGKIIAPKHIGVMQKSVPVNYRTVNLLASHEFLNSS